MTVAGRAVLAGVLAGGLLLAGIAFLAASGNQSSPDPPDLGTGGPGSARPLREAPPGTGAPSSRGPARPVSLSIPAIDVRTRLDDLGVNADGTVEVPSDPDEAGWYRLGTRPGARGSAVILGHVDSVDGPAVFYRLGTLNRGAGVIVRLADGSSVRFRVRSVTVYPNARFPARKVYAAAAGRTLNLVTCGGVYDAARGGYQANVVVHARLVRTHRG